LCPHCQKQIDLFRNNPGGEQLAGQTGLDLLGRLLIDPVIADGADNGLTIAECSVSATVHQQMDRIIDNLMKKMQSNPKKKGNQTMKIAIPTADGKLCAHFGHCQRFAFVTVDPDSKTILKAEMLSPPPHEPGVLPKWVADNGATLIIAGGMGQRAQQLFNQHEVEVLVGAPADSPENLAMAYLNDALQTGQNICDH
jgi:ATP-binding protein involved in chromosome partitioning